MRSPQKWFTVWMRVAAAVLVLLTECHGLRLISLADDGQVICFEDDKRNKTPIFMILKLTAAYMKRRPENSDWEFMKEFCHKQKLNVSGLMLTFGMLSFNNEDEEFFLSNRLLFEYRIPHPGEFSEEVLLGIASNGKWMDRSDTSYIWEHAYYLSFESIDPGICLYVNLTSQLDRFAIKPCKNAENYQGPTTFIICKSVVNDLVCKPPKDVYRPKPSEVVSKGKKNGTTSQRNSHKNNLDMWEMPLLTGNRTNRNVGVPETITAHMKKKGGATLRIRGRWTVLPSTVGFLLTIARDI